MRVDTNAIQTWQVATKIKDIKAKPLVNLIVDPSVTSKFMVSTLEGLERLCDNVIICVGETGDAWQQKANKLLAKYTVIDIDKDGWLICTPKPDNAVDCVEVTRELLAGPPVAIAPPDIEMYKAWDFYIFGLYGETTNFGKNTQWGMCGDYICRNQTDPTDVWIVKRKIFDNSYVIKP